MPSGSRPLAKTERQRLIASLVSRKRIGTQHELIAALAVEGCRVTQATVSRDNNELGLHKTRDALGQRRYALAQRPRKADPQEALRTVLAQFGHVAAAASNIVVLRSELGSAPSIARALDELRHDKVIGTLAGDDTCLVIAAAPADARALARELTGLIEGS